MTTQPFRFVHDLYPLNDAQRRQYLDDLSRYIKLPPELNGLDIIDMNDEESGGRKLVAYARRGTCEVLRDVHGINVDGTVRVQGAPGAITYQSSGTNAKGRKEIALGSHFIDGLTGKALSDADMTAHTRSLRRLTLQFVCAGLLDESEIRGMTSIKANKATLAELAAPDPQPVVQPSEAVGTDVTGRDAEKLIADAKAEVLGPDGMGVPTPLAEPKPKRKYTKRNTVDLGAPGTMVKAGDGSFAVVPTSAPVTVNVPPGLTPGTTVTVDKAPDPNPPALPPVACLDCGVALNEHKMVNSALTCPVKKAEAPFANTRIVEPGQVPPTGKEEYVKKLGTLVRNLESEGSMMPSPGIGGAVRKMRAFFAMQSGAANIDGMDTEQWQEVLDFCDGYVKDNGYKGLTVYVNKALGVS